MQSLTSPSLFAYPPTLLHVHQPLPLTTQFFLQYDNVVMEEAAQILEVETFIPLMLQNTEDGVSRLKRVILIGDHHQVITQLY